VKLATLAGIAIVAAHGAGFVWLAQHSRGADLAVEVPALVVRDGPPGPGLHRRHWSASYRGGHVREVGASELVGPFQDPITPACSGRVVVGQKLLETMAPVMAELVTAEMRGIDIFPVGAFVKVRSLSLRWARLESNPSDRRIVGKAGAPDGYVRANATVVFDRGAVDLVVAFIPIRAPTSLKFRIAAIADLDFNNSVLRWVGDKLGADRIATGVAREQIDDILVTTFAPPPPFELPGGQTLQFTYCDGPIEIVDGAYGALPFAVAFSPLPSAPQVLPPKFGDGTRVTPSADTTLALDLDVDALNALLFELWRTGWLDRQLAEVGLDRRFNSDPIVTDYLSIRISPLALALPPVIAPHGDGLRLAADARLSIADGDHVIVGRGFGALDFRFVTSTTAALPISVDLGVLELACERSPTLLVPCYSDLVATMRGRGAEFHGALTDAFAALLADIFIDRHLGAPGLPAELVITAVVPSVTGTGTLHLQLDGKLVPTP
jgi:hypothetical protein